MYFNTVKQLGCTSHLTNWAHLSMKARSSSKKIRKTVKKTVEKNIRFHPGMKVERSGIYEVFHATHRVTHEVTLLQGQDFPMCSRCKEKVSFELLKAVPSMNQKNSPLVHVVGVFIPEAA
jgi:hypothetical protein